MFTASGPQSSSVSDVLLQRPAVFATTLMPCVLLKTAVHVVVVPAWAIALLEHVSLLV